MSNLLFIANCVCMNTGSAKEALNVINVVSNPPLSLLLTPEFQHCCHDLWSPYCRNGFMKLENSTHSCNIKQYKKGTKIYHGILCQRAKLHRWKWIITSFSKRYFCVYLEWSLSDNIRRYRYWTKIYSIYNIWVHFILVALF